jgi:ABC-type transporter Mla subunit MlaD
LARSRSDARGASLASQQIRVGLFTVVALVAAGAVVVTVSNIGQSIRGYPIAVHFKDVRGLQEGASVQVSGVEVGSVTGVKLMRDQTVLVEAAINKGTKIYRESKFVVTSTITGQSTLEIRPPADVSGATVLAGIPADPNDAPWGVVPPTIGDLVSESEVRLKSFDKTIALINHEMPEMLHKFDRIADHTDTLVTGASANLTSLTASLNASVAELDHYVRAGGDNLVELTGSMNTLVKDNKVQVQQLVTALSDTAKNLNTTMANFASLTGDPTIKASLIQTAVNFKDASEKLRSAATDLQSLTGDPKVQAELRSTIADLSGVTAKANAILGDYSTAGSSPGSAAGAPPAGGSGTQAPAGTPGETMSGSRHDRAFSLVEPQVRLYWSNKFNGGPTSDLNVKLLPRSPTSLTFGANSLGYNTTYNALIDHRFSRSFTLSGGALYSNLGLKAVYRPGVFGVDARLYNSKNPTLDLYGDIRLAHQLEIFYGERNVFGPNVATPTFGLQANL